MTKILQRRCSRIVSVGLAIAAAGALAAQSPSPSLPDTPGKDTVQRVCSACHPATVVLGRGMSREGWGQIVASMITRGAKGTPAEFSTVTDYLAKNFPVGSSAAAGPQKTKHIFQAGSGDRQSVDTAAADRGKTVYSADCASCHGPQARGGAHGSDLVRSTVVLHDRYGNELGPYLSGKHPSYEGRSIAALTPTQVQDVANFLHQAVEDTLRSGPYTKVINVLTGNSSAGAAYFNGPGGCTQCHSASGDMAGIASRYDAPTLQQRILFPRTVVLTGKSVAAIKPVTVTVTPPGGDASTGTLVRMDDFNLALTDASGTYHAWKRTPDLKVEVHDPYAGHEELLDKITDADIHNLVAYLETLK